MDYTDLGPAMADASIRTASEKNAKSLGALELRVATLEAFVVRQSAIIQAIESRLREHMFPCQ